MEIPDRRYWDGTLGCNGWRAKPGGDQTGRRAAFTMLEIMITVAIISLILAIAMPNLLKAREKAQRTACIANLKKLSHMKELWAFEKNKPLNAVPNSSDITPYLGGGKMPSCPANGTYTLGRVSRTPGCSLADLGHDAGESDSDEHHAQD